MTLSTDCLRTFDGIDQLLLVRRASVLSSPSPLSSRHSESNGRKFREPPNRVYRFSESNYCEKLQAPDSGDFAGLNRWKQKQGNLVFPQRFSFENRPIINREVVLNVIFARWRHNFTGFGRVLHNGLAYFSWILRRY